MKTAYATFFAVVLALVLFGSAYTVSETEQVILTQFGKPVGGPITEAGLKFKVPFIQTVNRLDKRILEWDGTATEMPTKDKLYISVATFARWRISHPETFFVALRDDRTARSRLNDILGSETRNIVAGHDLVELVRTTKDRKPAVDSTLGEAALSSGLPAIHFGREALEEKILKASVPKLTSFGIELLDVRISRLTYNPIVAAKIFQRMVSERQQIASRYRAEGEGEAAKILGSRERELKQIDSEAYRQVQTFEGKADAEASAIYAAAYNQTPQAREFYTFLRSLETYRTSFERGTTLILSTDDGFLRFLKGEGLSNPVPTSRPAEPKARTESLEKPGS
jgi:membrane protease subunit HflC